LARLRRLNGGPPYSCRNSELREKSRRFDTDGGTGGVGAFRQRRRHQGGKDESPGDDGATGAAGIKQNTWRDGKADGHDVRLHEQQLPIRSRSPRYSP
jgi:hypothetical protein